MNFHVVQLQYCIELRKLTFSQLVQTFQNIIIWYFRQETSSNLVSNFLNIIIMKSKKKTNCEIHHCIMSTSNSKVVVDHESSLCSSLKPILFLDFPFLESDFQLDKGIPDDLLQSRENLRVSISKFGKSLLRN